MDSVKFSAGAWGEALARNYLKELGYQVLAHNWRYKHLEIDIVAREGNTLVVVEVKTRKSEAYGSPESFVSKAKQRYLIHAANAYLTNHAPSLECRFDVVAIIYGRGAPKIRHIPDAFCPEML